MGLGWPWGASNWICEALAGGGDGGSTGRGWLLLGALPSWTGVAGAGANCASAVSSACSQDHWKSSNYVQNAVKHCLDDSRTPKAPNIRLNLAIGRCFTCCARVISARQLRPKHN